MSDDSRHFQSLSIAILAIATTALGLGIFAGYFRSDAESPSFILITRAIASSAAIIYYAILAVTVSNILLEDRDGRPTGGDVVHGPLMWMMQIMWCVATIFFLDVVSALRG